VNTRVRKENEDKIRQIVAATASEPLFTGNQHQLANSKVTSRFGEKALYEGGGARGSRARSTSATTSRRSPRRRSRRPPQGRCCTRAISGSTATASWLDHGLGLASIYGHLSRLDVEAGARVEIDQRLGLSGATGLAGGDHLALRDTRRQHLRRSIEWWDAKWVTDHVAPNLNPTAN
jgi:hypothetical protein